MEIYDEFTARAGYICACSVRISLAPGAPLILYRLKTSYSCVHVLLA